MSNTIKIFLASSAELKDDRKEFEIFIGRQNKKLQRKGIFLHLDIWEDFIDAISQTRLQDEYNKRIQEADIFAMLFFTKVGMYTSEEFDKALEQFKKANKPFIYTYFKNAHIKFGDLKREEANSVWDFQEKLKNLGHFQTEYENIAELKNHFRDQLDELLSIIIDVPSDYNDKILKIPKCLAAGQPSIPPEFIGRETELADIKQKLEKNNLLLINAEGGMGKTTLAGKYLEDNLGNYKHYAWLFCDTGITEQMKTLAQQLHVDLKEYTDGDAQLGAIKTAMENLEKPCLLVLDNANDEKYIEVFRQHFGGLHWHILLTSRCHNIFLGNECTLNHLKPPEAKAFFKTFHNEEGDEFESLLDKFLLGIGYNTLMIELFSKNLHEISALGETLADMLEIFNKKNLFLGEKSFEIKTAYTGNVHKQAATTDQILEVLYDVTKLEETERYLMVNLALLPAENHLLTLLIEVLTPKDKIAFAKQLKSLSQKGWLNTDTKSYRMSPVVQQIILSKNKETLLKDASLLIKNLNQKLEHDGVSIVNLQSYSAILPYAELARSVTEIIDEENFELALLLSYLSDYYKGTGNFQSTLQHLRRASRIFKKVNTENYAVSLWRLGHIYQQQGDFKKALLFFEQYNNLCKDLFEANPHSESLKNGLAISYEKLGDIYQQQGDFKKALQFFEQRAQLGKELFEANPHSESLKNGLAISYSNLGDIYQQQGDFKKALQFFEQDLKLTEELFEGNPHSESLKNGLAISYEKLGDIYQQQGDFKKALQFFEQDLKLTEELFEANPHSESLKNGLAISYSKLGDIYKRQEDLRKALQFFKQYNGLCKELFEANSHSESLKSNLAISYERLGDIYKQQGDFKKASQFFKQRAQLGKELFEANPHSVGLYNGLAISYIKLARLHIDSEEPEKAKDYFQQAETIWIQLTEAVPEAIEYQNNLDWVKEQLKNL